MTKIPITAILPVLALLFGASGPALADGAAKAQARTTSLQYQSGGDTAASRARMERAVAANGYDLEIRLPADAWRDAQVTVRDADQLTILHAAAGGPLFYARVPAGAYTVTVTSGSSKDVIEHVDVAPGHVASVTAHVHA